MYYEAREETGPSSYEPQVIIKGGPNHNMVMTHHISGLQIGQLTRHEIDMTEVQKSCDVNGKLLKVNRSNFAVWLQG